MLDLKLLNLLACPDCRVDLVYRRQAKTEELICPNCRRRFSLNQGIPQLAPKKQLVPTSV